MNFQQLETFRWIARLRSFSLAAQHVNATQSTVSMRVADLEGELGVILLDRSRRKVALTPKGRDLLRYAEEMALLVSEIRQFVGNPGAISGTLRLGAAELIALTWLPRLVQAINQTYPLVDVELHCGLGGDMLSRLDAGELDLALMPTDGRPIRGMRIEPLGTVRFGFVASHSMAVPTRSQSPLSLLRRPIITHGAGSVLHAMLIQWSIQSNAKMSRVVTSNSMEASAKLAVAGLGVTFLPIFYYESMLESGMLTRIRVQPSIPPIGFKAVFSHERATPLIEAVVQLASKHSAFTFRQ